jgi:pimeloyl-ACP methyl ester carboxylesterase
MPRPVPFLGLATCLALCGAAPFVPAATAPAPVPGAAVHAPEPADSVRVLELRGIRMYVEQHGPRDARALVLLHGGVGNGRQFDSLVPAFAHHYRVIVPDLRAQGRTSDGPGPLTYHAMAEDVAALLSRLGVTRADVMGWSDGGVTGLDLAIHHPKLVRHLVTLGANFSPDGLNLPDQAWLSTATADSFGEGTCKAYEELAPDPAHYRIAMEKTLTLWRTEPRFTPAQLGSIRAHTLVIAGEHDVIRPEHTQALADAIPGATLWIAPGASHSVMLERPVEVSARVLAFLADVPGPASPPAAPASPSSP